MTRSIFACLLVLVVAVLSVANGQASMTDFLSWAKRHGKTYKSDAERNARFRVWTENQIKVAQINAENTSWAATIENRFGDLSSLEFKDTMLMNFNPKPTTKHTAKVRKTSGIAVEGESFDWRDHGAVTEVQDQGMVGSCWAFSTIGSVEGQWYLDKKELVDLSEEYLVDCDGESDGKHADCGVFGGWPYLAFEYIIDVGGVPTEVTYPYCSGTGDCYPCMVGPPSLCGLPPSYCDRNITAACPDAQLYASISDWTDVATDETIIARQLVDIGPLSALLDATQLQFYKSGIWTGQVDGTSPWLACHPDNLDHAVLLVGYGSENGTDYWTVKNSWGTDFGEDGYFRIVRGQGTCGINTAVTTALR
jgi:cathepsin F